MDEVGLAVTVEPVLELNPFEGVQLYVLAPVAINVAVLPGHSCTDEGDTLTTGSGLTITGTIVVPVQPLTSVPLTVYVVVVVGFALTLEPLVALKPVDGDQV